MSTKFTKLEDLITDKYIIDLVQQLRKPNIFELMKLPYSVRCDYCVNWDNIKKICSICRETYRVPIPLSEIL